MWNMVREQCPEPFVECIENMIPEERAVFILNGLNVKYTHECKGMYDCLSNYVHKLYVQFEHLISV